MDTAREGKDYKQSLIYPEIKERGPVPQARTRIKQREGEKARANVCRALNVGAGDAEFRLR